MKCQVGCLLVRIELSHVVFVDKRVASQLLASLFQRYLFLQRHLLLAWTDLVHPPRCPLGVCASASWLCVAAYDAGNPRLLCAGVCDHWVLDVGLMSESVLRPACCRPRCDVSDLGVVGDLAFILTTKSCLLWESSLKVTILLMSESVLQPAS